ncbi:MAG: hypothetical protein AB7K04_02040 [Pseudorhodoplanes sp.]
MVRPERLGDIDQAAAQQFEGEIREFVRRDASLRRRTDNDMLGDKTAVENLETLIAKVSEAASQEMDRVIGELTAMRDHLRSEGDRVRREITNFAGLSQTAMTSMKIIADSVGQWKPPVTSPEATPHQPPSETL